QKVHVKSGVVAASRVGQTTEEFVRAPLDPTRPGENPDPAVRGAVPPVYGFVEEAQDFPRLEETDLLRHQGGPQIELHRPGQFAGEVAVIDQGSDPGPDADLLV